MILSLATSLVAVAAFGLVLWHSHIVAVAREAMQVTMAGLSAMLDSELDDDAKEVAVRRAGLGLIVAAFSIFWRFSLALALAAAPILLVDALEVVARDDVFALMLRWDYILSVSIVAMAVSEFVRRRNTRIKPQTAGMNRYSAGDRFFHIVAFSSPSVLKTASWIEDRLISFEKAEPSTSPLFVTSLARGGTTALLNAFSSLPNVATHLYRDMPFVTAPVLWNRFAGGQSRGVERQKRAHGDGLEIDLETPEAFEEVIWKLFWPEKFAGPTIDLWNADARNQKADLFIARHMTKVMRARGVLQESDVLGTGRYCSKNNANVARIAYLKSAFPNCQIVVPVRRPESHAASLLRQHKNFSSLQAEDDFVRRYMRDIGHFEFGQIHKPIGFPGFEGQRYDPFTGDYWLHYWVQAFRHIIEKADECFFVLQDDLRRAPDETMKALCQAIDLKPSTSTFAPFFRAEPDTSPTSQFAPELYEEAAALYRELADLATS